MLLAMSFCMGFCMDIRMLSTGIWLTDILGIILSGIVASILTGTFTRH